MSKPRVRVQRNTRTEVMADRRTRRQRTRSDEKRAAIEAAEREQWEAFEELRDWELVEFGP